MKQFWIMFNNLEYLKDWTTMGCHVYVSKYCKVLTTACCDMQSKDGATKELLWKNLNIVMTNNGVPDVNSKGFMINNAKEN